MSRQFTRSSNQRLDCGSNAIHNTSNITVAAWAYADSFVSGDYNYIISREESNSPYQGFTLRQYNLTPHFVIAVGVTEYTASGTLPSTGVWHHWAGTYDGETVTLWIDGASSGTNTSPSGNMRAAAGGTKTYIGDSYAWTPRFWNGKIAEVAIWNTALGSVDIQALNRGISPLCIRSNNLVSYWPIKGAYSPELDLVGRQHGTLSNNPVSALHSNMIPTGFFDFQTLSGMSPRESPPLVDGRRLRRTLATPTSVAATTNFLTLLGVGA